MGDLIKFVDSLVASPTVRLDINEANGFNVKKFTAPPPRLRRSMADNAMRDGFTVGTAVYGSRTLTLEMESIRTTQDAAAIDLQKLWRELDRPTNWLMYQPNGLTKPVFFRTFRSDTSTLEDVIAQNAMRNFTIEILAEPFALGLKETLGPFTVNNDLAAGSNGCFFDISTVIGDVPAPAILWHDNTNQTTQDLINILPTASPLTTWTQAESGPTLGTDTTNPGGSADSAMSGAGTTNYVRTSFSTTLAMTARVLWNVPAITPPGSYRVLGIVRVTNNTATRSVQLWAPNSSATLVAQSPVITLPTTGVFPSRRLVDFGLVTIGEASYSSVGYSSSALTRSNYQLQFHAASTGVQPLDWDSFLLVPAGDQATTAIVTYLSTATTNGLVLDGVAERATFQTIVGDPTTGSGTANFSLTPSMVGGFLPLTPNVTNRVTMVRSIGGTTDKTHSCSVSVAYWPRYLTVRPVSS